MKCPPKIKVGYKDIAIDLVRSDFTKQTDCYGEYQHRANKIEIQQDLTPNDFSNTLLHEVLHAVVYEHSLTVDGNVFRVLSRVFGITTPINESKGIKEFKLLADELLNPDDPGTHNQALMEFGALVCTPKNPTCDTCIFNHTCIALQEKRIDVLPVKLKKLKVRKRYFNYLVFDIDGESTLLRQRKNKDIWQNLFEFPLYETLGDLQDESELVEIIRSELLSNGSFTLKKYNELPIIHKLTHQTIYTSFWIVEPKEKPQNMTSWQELENLALPVLLQNFVDKYHTVN